MWKGTRAILKANPAITKISATKMAGPKLVRAAFAISDSLVDPVIP
jgi:hypothetical protein